MVMSFKVFGNNEKIAEYIADILRKQFNNNPTTIAGFHLSKEHASVFGELKRNVENHTVDFSQINILDYDDDHPYYEALGVPTGQIYSISYKNGATNFISDKAKTKENKGRLTMQILTIDENGELDISVHQGLMEAREIFLVITGTDRRDMVEKLYRENGKTNSESSDLKTHRMVNAILDKEAATGLPESVKEYFTARFA